MPTKNPEFERERITPKVMDKATTGRPFSYDEKYRASHPPKSETRYLDTLVAQTASVTSRGGITIAALPALDDERFFDEIPKPERGLTASELTTITEIMGEQGKRVAEKVYSAEDGERTWDKTLAFVEQNRELLERELGEIDVTRLTPWQAIYLSQKFSATAIRYDHLAFRSGNIDRTVWTSHIGDPELKKHVETLSDAELEELVKSRRAVLENMLPSELLDSGSGVCAHYALTAVAIFYNLKIHQSAGWNELDGTELLYTGPYGAMREGVSDDTHATM